MSLLSSPLEYTLNGIVFGVDEVGRGCLAGPVVAACVAFDWSKPEIVRALNECVVIRDSKVMSRAQRAASAAAIREVAVAIGVGEVDAASIDKINILQATFEAMRRAVGSVGEGVATSDVAGGGGLGVCERRDGRTGRFYLIDGNKIVPNVDWEQEAIIDGDAKVFSIAAASIVAKEYRDQLMETLHKTYPQYGFAQHKGYGTKQHYAAIAEHGIISEHRRTFLKGVVG